MGDRALCPLTGPNRPLAHIPALQRYIITACRHGNTTFLHHKTRTNIIQSRNWKHNRCSFSETCLSWGGEGGGGEKNTAFTFNTYSRRPSGRRIWAGGDAGFPVKCKHKIQNTDKNTKYSLHIQYIFQMPISKKERGCRFPL